MPTHKLMKEITQDKNTKINIDKFVSLIVPLTQVLKK